LFAQQLRSVNGCGDLTHPTMDMLNTRTNINRYVIFSGRSSRASGFESSSRMITLIIKFDKNDMVSDFKSRTSNF
jgi:hypothetical protein